MIISDAQAYLLEEWGNQRMSISDKFPPPIYRPTITGTGPVSKAKSIIQLGTPNFAGETIYVPARFQGPRWEEAISSDAVATIKSRIPFNRVKRIPDKVVAGNRDSASESLDEHDQEIPTSGYLPTASGRPTLAEFGSDIPLTGTQVTIL